MVLNERFTSLVFALQLNLEDTYFRLCLSALDGNVNQILVKEILQKIDIGGVGVLADIDTAAQAF